jgi:hypothetical protein
MRVSLSYIERLNLRALMGQWRGWGHSELRRVWNIMDRLELSEEEKARIGYVVRIVDGVEREFWDARPANPPDPKEFDFHERDVARIKNALRGCPYAGNDRVWLSGLLEKFLPEEEGQ